MSRLWAGMSVAFFLFGSSAFAAEESKPEPAPPAVSAEDATAMKLLFTERLAIEQKARADRAESQLAYEHKTGELEKLVQEAARRAGIDLKDGWQPDIEKRVWRKP